MAMGVAKMNMLRLEVWIHIAKTLALQQCRVAEGPSVGLHSFLPVLIRDIIAELAPNLRIQDVTPDNCKMLELKKQIPGSLKDFASKVAQKLWGLHEKCLAEDGKSFAHTRDNLQEELGKMRRSDFDVILKSIM